MKASITIQSVSLKVTLVAVLLLGIFACNRGELPAKVAPQNGPTGATNLSEHSQSVLSNLSRLLEDRKVRLPFDLPSAIGEARLVWYELGFENEYSRVKGLSPWVLQLVYSMNEEGYLTRGERADIRILLARSMPSISPWDNVVPLRRHADFVDRDDTLVMEGASPDRIGVGRVADVDVMIIDREGWGTSLYGAWRAISSGVSDAYLDPGVRSNPDASQPSTDAHRLKQFASTVATQLNKKGVTLPFDIPMTIGDTKLDWYELRYPTGYARQKGLNPWILQLQYVWTDNEPALCVYLAKEAPPHSPMGNVGGLYNNAGFKRPTQLMNDAGMPRKDWVFDRVGNMDVSVIARMGWGASAQQAIDSLREELRER